MSGTGDVIVADVYCVKCGQSLRLRAVGEPCAGCGGSVEESLRATIMAGGHRHVRRVGRALMLAAWTNVGLGIGCILNPLTMWDTSLLGFNWYAPLGVVFLLSVSGYAWLQVVAGMRAAVPRPGERAVWWRSALLLGGGGFALAAMGAAVLMAASTAGMTGAWLAWVGLAVKALLFGLVLFLWGVGRTYGELCRIGGLRALRGQCGLGAQLAQTGALLFGIGYLFLPLGANGLPVVTVSGAEARPAYVAGWGLLVLVAGLGLMTVTQWRLGRWLRALADTLGDRTVLTGARPE